ncbi:FxLD family lanthipeptide [Streptomyces sp. PT12]|uniref:FxLD family lanthipeptide n=1 Tax=Streptomyces sp. PT12 TaxID=1510197 RepID=UPI000DE25AEA|nr:FxLD family lanthipeptide [Streptomyces sp. PT12]RBM14155.1 FxLD family lantipeptide [Streptomyces sp. PT12]
MLSTATIDRPESDIDPFDLDVTIVTEVGADTMPDACGTGDGCESTCASACASAV